MTCRNAVSASSYRPALSREVPVLFKRSACIHMAGGVLRWKAKD